MIINTEGIVFRTTRYSETSIIADVFTLEKGLMSYIMGGVRKKKSRVSPGLFQVMSIVDVIVYHSEANKLHRMKEIHAAYHYQSIPFDVRKSSIMLFLAELCSRTIRETEANPELFYFIKNQLVRLDEREEDFANTHLLFMIGLAAQLGFELQPPIDPQQQFFDLEQGQFALEAPRHFNYVKPPLSQLLSELMMDLENPTSIHITRDERRALLDKLIDYFRLHVVGMRELKAHRILAEVL